MVKIYSTTYINSVVAIRRGMSSSLLPRFFQHGTEFRVVFSSAEGFGTEFREYASSFVPRNGIPSCFLFHGRERNSESMLLFLFHGTEFRVVFSSVEGFGTEFRRFLFRGTAGIPSEISICSDYSFFRGIIFLSEIPNPICNLCGAPILYFVVSAPLPPPPPIDMYTALHYISRNTPCRKNALPFFCQSSIQESFSRFLLHHDFYPVLINGPIIYIEGF
jgi:hypothetical protein